MAIELYNTLTGKKEKFVPIHKEFVGMYHCGPTVYQYAHIGNMRSYVFADILRRTIEYNGLNVKQIINITDVGHLTNDSDMGADKVEVEAKKEGKTAKEVTEFFTRAYLNDIASLNVKTDGTVFPRATDHIKEQIRMIQTLDEKGYAYQTSDGIYFDTSKFADYGKLGNIDLKGLVAGARVEANPEKRNPTDFALWKFSVPGESRQQEWPSPWGVGYPGWHIECSAMSMKYLGENFDVHTGGIDHIPVHHNNEIAQSEATTGKPYVNYWMHHEFLNINSEKIAKSVGNTTYLSDIVAKGINPLAYRFWLLMAHYRTPMNFNWDALAGTETALKKLYNSFIDLGEKNGVISQNYRSQFKEYMNNDLDTPRALTVLWDVIKDPVLPSADKRATILDFDTVLGLGFDKLRPAHIPKDILDLAEERETARKNGDWYTSDRLRDKIKALGYEVKDTSEGPKIYTL